MISFLMGSMTRIYSVIIGLGLVIYTFMLRKNTKLTVENENLASGLKAFKVDSEKIVIIQKKQAEIASSPRPDRAILYKQLRDLANKPANKP